MSVEFGAISSIPSRFHGLSPFNLNSRQFSRRLQDVAVLFHKTRKAVAKPPESARLYKI